MMNSLIDKVYGAAFAAFFAEYVVLDAPGRELFERAFAHHYLPK